MQTPPTDSIYFHNVAAFEPSASGGTYLRRMPLSIRQALSPLGRMVSDESAGVELRFVTESDNFLLSLGAEPSCLDPFESNPLTATLFRGDFFHSQRVLVAGKVNYIQITDIICALKNRLAQINREQLKPGGFSPDVWRLCFGRFPATFIELTTNHLPCRAPLASEMPATRWLAYGSSITNGASPTGHHLAYIYQAARHLGADVYNQGLSGSCRCQREIADYFASREDWDLITLEIGVNMREECTAEVFRERAAYMIGRITKAHPHKPVVLITIYPNIDMTPYGLGSASEVATKQAAFNDVLRQLADSGPDNLHLIEGSAVLGDFRNLTPDLLHPSDFGHIEMGRNLATLLRPLLDSSALAPRAPTA